MIRCLPHALCILVAAAAAQAPVGLARAGDFPYAPSPEAVVPPPPPVQLSAGVRYWYSWSDTNYAFTNRNPRFGNPTSTLDWTSTAHSGEVFARLDHEPSGVFLRGSLGIGGISDGSLTDRDFLSGQIEFSDTDSVAEGDSFRFGMADVGIAFTPDPRIKVGPFVGYHYWNDKPDATGALCNPDDVGNVLCPLGVHVIRPGVAAIGYDTTWHALRLGVNGGVELGDGLSFTGEVAWVPYASWSLEDSHYQRVDLGPVPNILSGGHGVGLEAQGFFNYALTPNFEVGLGARYWGLFSNDGSSRFKQFSRSYPVTDFDLQRYGLLFQAKYRF